MIQSCLNYVEMGVIRGENAAHIPRFCEFLQRSNVGFGIAGGFFWLGGFLSVFKLRKTRLILFRHLSDPLKIVLIHPTFPFPFPNPTLPPPFPFLNNLLLFQI